MIHINKQSGFTPTLTFKQSIVKDLKNYKGFILTFICGVRNRREQSSQLKSQCRGFSLVETLVAITILLIVITGPMAISSSASRSASFSSEQVIAQFLAQEGVEFAQNARDDWLLFGFPGNAASQWIFFTNTSGTYADCYGGSGCGLEMNQFGFVGQTADCSSIDNCRLYYNYNRFPDNDRLFYTYSHALGNEISPFTRVIKLTDNGDEVHVVSTVTWRTGSQRAEQKVVVETYLYNTYGI